MKRYCKCHCQYCINSKTHHNRRQVPLVDVSIMSNALAKLMPADAKWMGQFLRWNSTLKTG